MTEKKKTLIIIAGNSGTGKTTIANLLVQNPQITKLITSTTRPPRPGEVHEEDYYFLTKELFQKEIEAGNFFEHIFYNGNYYGIHGKVIDYILNKKKTHGVVSVDMKGLKVIKEYCLKKNYSVFAFWFTNSSLENIIKNMKKRGSSDTEIVERLIADSQNEVAKTNCMNLIDAIIETDTMTLEECVKQIKKLLE